jgi:hypothetical protein
MDFRIMGFSGRVIWPAGQVAVQPVLLRAACVCPLSDQHGQGLAGKIWPPLKESVQPNYFPT